MINLGLSELRGDRAASARKEKMLDTGQVALSYKKDGLG